MKIMFFPIFIFITMGLFAAPIEKGFSGSSSDARQKVIDASIKYLNTPYVYAGFSSSGVDCSGFVSLSFKDGIGVDIPRSTSGLFSLAEKITLDNAQPGDVLFFKTDPSNPGGISHVAIFLGNGRFIHAASAGEKTGVIYSDLSEPYWARAYAGAGRILPEASGKISLSATVDYKSTDTKKNNTNKKGSFLYGAGIAPVWNFLLREDALVRGISSQFRLGTDTYIFGPRIVFCLDLRPEYDWVIGVFRLPITISAGYKDKITFFAGPVLSFGDASLSVDNGERFYSGGSNWIGSAGLTYAPFILETSTGEIAPYLEAAWQYYFHEGIYKNTRADFSAATRFSSGIRWTKKMKN